MQTRAVALLSGGLDSTLAIRVIQEQGIEAIGINFITPFFTSRKAEEACGKLEICLEIVDISNEHLEVVKNPKHGYGKNMNPCIDCHALMVKTAEKIMKDLEASFIITGEVLGERPKSQNRQALQIVEKESGCEGYILRPLSAKCLSETIPEQKGLVDREKLLGIKGRSRRPQLALAAKYGLEGLPTPAGGCLLTDKTFSERLRNLLDGKKEVAVSDVEILKYGRHFSLGEKGRAVVSRNKEENEALLKLAQSGDLLFQVKSWPGPVTILRGEDLRSSEIVERAAALTARYSKARHLPEVEVSCWMHDEETEKVICIKHPFNSVECQSIVGN